PPHPRYLHSFPTRRSSDLKISAPRSRAWRFVVPYGLYTGADNKYAFFAPVVPNARRVRVRVLCGEEWIPFETSVNSSESRLRLQDRKSTRLNSSHLVISYA